MVIAGFKTRRAFVQIPILFGLLIMAIALPVATKLVQQNQENRGLAGDDGGCTRDSDCGSGRCTVNGCVDPPAPIVPPKVVEEEDSPVATKRPVATATKAPTIPPKVIADPTATTRPMATATIRPTLVPTKVPTIPLKIIDNPTATKTPVVPTVPLKVIADPTATTRPVATATIRPTLVPTKVPTIPLKIIDNPTATTRPVATATIRPTLVPTRIPTIPPKVFDNPTATKAPVVPTVPLKVIDKPTATKAPVVPTVPLKVIDKPTATKAPTIGCWDCDTRCCDAPDEWGGSKCKSCSTNPTPTPKYAIDGRNIVNIPTATKAPTIGCWDCDTRCCDAPDEWGGSKCITCPKPILIPTKTPDLKVVGESCKSNDECNSGLCYSESDRLGGSPFLTRNTCHVNSIETMDRTTQNLAEGTAIGTAALGTVMVAGALGPAGISALMANPTVAASLAALNLIDDGVTVGQCLSGDQNACATVQAIILNPIPGAGLVDDVADLTGALNHSQKLTKYLTGSTLDDVDGVDLIKNKLLEDHYILKQRYNLPSRDSIFNDPREAVREMLDIAKKENIVVRDASEWQSFFDENPSAAAMATENQIFIPEINNYDLLNDDKILKIRGNLEHELIHGLQNKYYPDMPVEVKEYQAYVTANMGLQPLEEDPEFMIGGYLFGGFGISGSVDYWYKNEGFSPKWDPDFN